MSLPRDIEYHLELLSAAQKELKSAKTWSESIQAFSDIVRHLKEIQREVCNRRLTAARSQLKDCDNLADWIESRIHTGEYYANSQRERSSRGEEFGANLMYMVDEDHLRSRMVEIWF